MLPTGKFPIQRVGIAVVAFLITGGMLFGGYALAQKMKAGPDNMSYWKARGISEFHLRDQGSDEILEVKAGTVKDLRPVMEALIDQVEKGKGRPVTEVRFTSAKTAGLENAYDSLSFALAEAQATGRYTLLPSAQKSVEATWGVHAKVEVGDKFLFVSLDKGNHRLYRAIGRPMAVLAQQSPNGGGV